MDRISDYLYCPTERAVEHLGAEGVTKGGRRVGDVMLDATLRHEEAARTKPAHRGFDLERGEYLLLTVHRPTNAGDARRLRTILESLDSSGYPTLFPTHPRTRKVMDHFDLADRFEETLQVVEPVDYLVFLSLLLDAAKVVTDSGGVQKEAFFFEVPCITLRGETEWEETLEGGWNVLVDANPQDLRQALERSPEGSPRREQFGDGHAAEKVVATLDGQG